MLDLNQYHDQNNYIRINDVEASDDRWHPIQIPRHFKFLDHTLYPMWTGKAAEWKINVTRNDGESFYMED